MKLWKRILIVCLLVILSILSLVIGNGYTMYQTAIQEVPLEEKLVEIQAKENYTPIEELPKTYLNAIIAVEDHRFYQHPGK